MAEIVNIDPENNQDNRDRLVGEVDPQGQVGDYQIKPGAGDDQLMVQGQPGKTQVGQPVLSADRKDLTIPFNQSTFNPETKAFGPGKQVGSFQFGQDTERVIAGDDVKSIKDFVNVPNDGWRQNITPKAADGTDTSANDNKFPLTPGIPKGANQVGDYNVSPGAGNDILTLNDNKDQGITAGNPVIDNKSNDKSLTFPLAKDGKPTGSIRFDGSTEEVNHNGNTWQNTPGSGWSQKPSKPQGSTVPNKPAKPQVQPTRPNPVRK